MKVLFASNNLGKLSEVRNVLADTDIEILSLADVANETIVDEDQPSFELNAYKKAKTYFDLYGIPTLADDSGLCVDALHGAPGIFSARFAKLGATDSDNNLLLLKQLEGVTNRKAHFICVLCFVMQDDVHYFKGYLHGMIHTEPIGNSGFGYDPIFYVPEEKATLATLGQQKKNTISHRAKALQEWKKSLL